MTETQLQHVRGLQAFPSAPYRVFEDGTAVWVHPMTFGKGRLCIGHADDPTGYNDGYCYGSIEAAFRSADAWDGQGDPPVGWHRHIQSGRRRENGDPATEYIQL